MIPKKVKNTDDLVLNATSIVSSGDKVDYTFTIEELELIADAVDAKFSRSFELSSGDKV